jgi:hypothetical protein
LRNLNVLIVDHNYGQDILALELAAPTVVSIATVSAHYFADRARPYLSNTIFEGSIEEYWDDQYEQERADWDAAAHKALEELHYLFPFDIILTPSDTFFYIRAIREAARSMEIPFVVVQKETTISPDGMDFHTARYKELFPFISDLMTVCSERHKEFWVKSGATPELIHVTGQPRFDYYDQRSLPVEVDQVLLLAFEFIAYLPENILEQGHDWSQFQREIVESAAQSCAEANIPLLIKPHPQQDPNEIKQIEEWAIAAAGQAATSVVNMIDRTSDARELIAASKCVIGFQTTALMEAAIAKKTTLYPFWGDLADSVKDSLIPFHNFEPAITIVKSQSDIVQEISKVFDTDHGSDDQAGNTGNQDFITEYLGPTDGHAAERVWDLVLPLVNANKREDTDNHNSQRTRRLAFIFKAFAAVITPLAIWNAMAVISLVTPERILLNRRKVYILQKAKRLRAHFRELLTAMFIPGKKLRYITGRR